MSCCTACCKSSGEHLDSTACTCMQDNGYNPYAKGGEENRMAYELGLPPDLRGPADATEWRGQTKRPNNGTFRNRGGFWEKVRKIEELSTELPSDLQWKLSRTNPEGARLHATCAFVCVRSSVSRLIEFHLFVPCKRSRVLLFAARLLEGLLERCAERRRARRRARQKTSKVAQRCAGRCLDDVAQRTWYDSRRT